MKRPIKIIKKAAKPSEATPLDPKRSEWSLLRILIARNIDKAQDIVRDILLTTTKT